MKNRNRPTSKGPFERLGRAAAAAVVLLAALASGCMRPLALQDEYFSSPSRSIATTNAETLRTVRHHRALQAAQHACPRTARPAAPSGPDLGSLTARAALAGTCASTVAEPRPVSAHGSTSNAHRRWLEDRVRELPDPTESAASVGDG